jgi:hypothetical protein
MKYDDGKDVRLGDIVSIELADGVRTARVVLLGDTAEYAGVDDKTAKWAIESKYVGKGEIMAEWTEGNPFAHIDPAYAPVGNTISTCLCDVILIRRDDES